MACLRYGRHMFYLLWFLLSLASFARAQPNTEVDVTFTAPAITSRPEIVYASGVRAEVTFAADAFVQGTAVPYEHLPAVDAVTPQAGYSIAINPQQAVSFCFYNVGSFYALLPRVLFYATMIFAVLARAHTWLIIGSLAASLTFSATAAIQGTADVWSGRTMGNNDLVAILGILTFSAAMFVPLLTWSKTVRNLGAEREEDAFGRMVIILWALLISIGSITLFVAMWDPALEYRSLFSVVVPVNMNMSCMPSSGQLDLTIGQPAAYPFLVLTSEFIAANGCQDVCSSLPTSYQALTKNAGDLTALTAKQADIFFTTVEPSMLTSAERLGISFTNYFLLLGSFATIWVVAKGIIAVAFGRRQLREIRNLIYVRLVQFLSRRRGEDLNILHHHTAHVVAKSVAYLYYGSAVADSIISVILMITTIIATEFILAELPSSVELYEVDSWSPWVSVGLVLAIAFASRFEGIIQDILVRLLNKSTRSLSSLLHGRPVKALGYDINGDTGKTPVHGESEPISQMFSGAWRRLRAKPRHWKYSYREFMDDNRHFWHDTWGYAKNNHAHFHLMRRIVISDESQKLPEGWASSSEKKEEYDHERDWQPFESFVDNCRGIEEEQRREHGEGFLWQPRVIQRNQSRYRATYDWDELKSIFGRRNASAGKDKPLKNDPADSPQEDQRPLFSKSSLISASSTMYSKNED